MRNGKESVDKHKQSCHTNNMTFEAFKVQNEVALRNAYSQFMASVDPVELEGLPETLVFDFEDFAYEIFIEMQPEAPSQKSKNLGQVVCTGSDS